MKDEKIWYLSRGIWGGVASIVGGLALLVGIEIDVNEVEALRESMLALATVVGGILSVVGRKRAESKIQPVFKKNGRSPQ